jgi:hypothetical protein
VSIARYYRTAVFAADTSKAAFLHPEPYQPYVARIAKCQTD